MSDTDTACLLLVLFCMFVLIAGSYAAHLMMQSQERKRRSRTLTRRSIR